jgi:hypothetical protein
MCVLAGLVVTRANIRIWIHDRDLGRLQQMLWEGHGGKLRVETSNNPRVKRFLDAVPYIMVSDRRLKTCPPKQESTQQIKKLLSSQNLGSRGTGF